MTRKSITAIIFSLLATPLFVIAETGIVNCTGPKCTYGQFIELIGNVMNFLLLWLAIPLATLAFAVAGIMLVVYAGNDGKRSEAKRIMWYAVLGLVIALSAWLIIDTLLGFLVTDSVRSQIPLGP